MTLLAAGVVVYGMSTEDILTATPAQFVAFAETYERHRMAEDWRAGMLASVFANCHRNPKKKPSPYQPRDFMPQYGGEGDSGKTEAELLAYWEGVAVPALNSRGE